MGSYSDMFYDRDGKPLYDENPYMVWRPWGSQRMTKAEIEQKNIEWNKTHKS